MKSWEKFVETLDLTKELEETYFDLRKYFQKEGWTQKDIESPPYYPNELMKLFHKFSDQRDEIFYTVRDYGFDVDNSSLTNYIQNKLKSIDDITPLRGSDGNNK